MMRTLRLGRAWAVVSGLAVAGAVSLTAVPAMADSAPADPTVTPTVTADGLPTAQINGVVWDQEIAGNTVFVGGNFTKARPAGSDPGVNEVNRTYLMSYNVTTGVMTSWAPVLNGQVKELALSPDKTRLYVAGQFTTIDGASRTRVAAFDTATGALVSTFKPSVNSTVNTVSASATAVVFGGIFTSVNGAARNQLAAVTTAGANLTGFVPTPAGGSIQASTFAPDGQSVVIGGAFTTMNGSSSPGYGLARLSLTDGSLLPLPVNAYARNGGDESAILSLESDGDNFYGTGYHYGGGGNIEGTFAADWATGSLQWVEDCHGDTYSSYPVGDVIYSASHKHYCGNSNGFPQTDPWSFYRATALTKTAKGVNTPDIYGYPDHDGEPRPDILYWYPNINTGTFTGKGQGPWSVSGDSRYVLYGGEFTRVNNVKQQGLVRFAVPSIAPNAEEPVLKTTNWPLSVKSFASGTVRTSWQTNWDYDNETLTYKLYRQSTNNPPIYTKTVTAPFWKPQTMSFTDTGLTPGSSQRYRVTATDPYGNTSVSEWITVTVSDGAPLSGYASKVLDDGAVDYWRLDETAGPTVYDWAGIGDAVAGSGVTFGQPGATGDSDTAASFSGTSDGLAASQALIDGPQTFAVEAWFRTTTTSGGKIVGFGNRNTGNSTSYDRHIYMETNGRVTFGVYPGSSKTITSSRAYNDGQWHQVVASLGSDGMKLYLDGTRVAQNAAVTSAQAYSGYWRIGGDSPWAGNAYFNGAIDDVAIYGAPLTAAQVDGHWVASGRASTLPVAPADAYGASVFSLNPDLYWRLGESTGSTAADSGPLRNGGVYSGGVTKGASGAISGLANTAATFNGSNGLVASAATFSNPTTYSEELWFRTTTTSGGKLIGFGNANSGTSSNYDRHVYMNSAGQLTFGVWTGQENTTTTTGSYNDGAWHHLVATQSSAGMRLYVDGQLRGSHAQTAAQDYTGYWRVGGDTAWGGVQPWFAGTIDEVAVYPVALTPQQVTQHFQLGSGTVPNQAPTADFTVTPDGLKVDVDGAGSSDPDGTIASYAWTFGPSGTGTGKTASYTFASGGTYTVGLTVTDDDGATAHVEKQVTVTPPNQAPTAAFSFTTSGLRVDVDGSASSDPDGTIASYAWAFEGGGSGSGATESHTFAAAGTYTVRLTVTDDDGATAQLEKQVTVAAPPNQAPDADFTVTATGLRVDVDASSSSDADGTVADYAWTFGASGTGSGKTTSFTFPAAGTYTIGLTVTDDDGATGHRDRTVTVSAPPGGEEPPANALAWDAFDRSVSNGWGSAQVGGSWTSTGTASRFSVASGVGTHSLTVNQTLTSTLDSVSQTSSDTRVTISPDKLLSGGGSWVTVQGRVVGSNFYGARLRLQADGTVQTHLMRGATAVRGGTVAGLTYAAGDQLRVRLQVTGTSPTQLNVKVWKVGDAEPTAWTYSLSDSTAGFQSAGSLGLQSYLFGTVTNGPIAIRFSDFRSVPVA